MSGVTSSLRVAGVVLKYTVIVIICALLIFPCILVFCAGSEGVVLGFQLLMGICEFAATLFGGPANQKGSEGNPT